MQTPPMTPRFVARALCMGLFLIALSGLAARAQPSGLPEEKEDRAFAKALGLFDRKEWGKAEDLLSRILRRVPGNLEAHYMRGIALRELGDPYSVMGAGRWSRAAEDFEAILVRDSSYRDVLYQYALLKRADQQFTSALDLADAQLRRKPELTDTRAGVLLFYRDFAVFSTEEDVAARHAAHASPYSAYAWGEALRRSGDAQGAVAVFYDLVEESESLPRVGALMGLARAYYALDLSRNGQDAVERAIADIRVESDAQLLFDDFQYVFTPAELAQYATLTTAEEYRAFFRSLWARRDPVPVEPVNARLAEHYARLTVAERENAYAAPQEGRYGPYRDLTLDFPETYGLSGRLNDKGLVYVRHGEPDDRVKVSGTTEYRQAEFWRYLTPELYFHFDKGAAGNAWHLAPFPPLHSEVLGVLAEWGGVYFQAAMKGGGDSSLRPVRKAEDMTKAWREPVDAFFPEIREFYEISNESIAIALTTDRYTPPEEIAPMQLAMLPAAFRGEGGRTLVTFYYALPIGQVMSRAGEADSVQVEVGLTLHDTSWELDGSFTDFKPLPNTTTDPTAAAVDLFSILVKPDSYHVALHASTQATGQEGTLRLDAKAPDFSGPELKMSTLVPAYSISEALMPGRFTRGDLYLQVNPFGVFSRRQSIFTYFEVYGLTLGSDGFASYSATYTLHSASGDGERSAVLTLRTEGAGPARTLASSSELDASSVLPGAYILRVHVRDETNGASVEQMVPLVLTE